jgi:shikimate dehydrogenase
MIVTALIGYPTDHSVSPALFGIYAAEHNLEYSHIKFNITKDNLGDVIRCLPKYGFAGVNITLPYKMDVIPYVDALSPEIKKIGAINTITVRDGKLKGYNTDMYGAISTIEEAFNRQIGADDNVVIFGTGGAARAVLAGVLQHTEKVTVIFRQPMSYRTKSLQNDFDGAAFLDYENINDVLSVLSSATIVCNATSVGMNPDVALSPLSKEMLNEAGSFKGKLFFDVIFNPAKTKFLIDAENNGAIVIGGINMMVYQGVKAFELWTGKKVGMQSTKKAQKKLNSLL